MQCECGGLMLPDNPRKNAPLICTRGCGHIFVARARTVKTDKKHGHRKVFDPYAHERFLVKEAKKHL